MAGQEVHVAACRSLPQLDAVHRSLFGNRMLIQKYKPQILAWLLFNVTLPVLACQQHIPCSNKEAQAAPTVQRHVQQWSRLNGRGSIHGERHKSRGL